MLQDPCSSHQAHEKPFIYGPRSPFPVLDRDWMLMTVTGNRLDWVVGRKDNDFTMVITIFWWEYLHLRTMPPPPCTMAFGECEYE